MSKRSKDTEALMKQLEQHIELETLCNLSWEIGELENPVEYDFESYHACRRDIEAIIEKRVNKLHAALGIVI